MNIVVAVVLAIIFGLLSKPAYDQNMLPDGVSINARGVYLVERRVLKRYKRGEIKAFKKMADDNGIQYQLVGKKHVK